MLTVTNRYGEIRVIALVATKSHAEFESALVKMHNSLEMYGHDPPKVFYTDNPAADKHFLESIFPSLTKNVTPVELYPTLGLFTIPPDVRVSVHSTATSINGACTRIMDDLDLDDSICLECGLDAEWNVNMTCGGDPEPTSIIQIAYKKWMDVFQVIVFGEFYFPCVLQFYRLDISKGLFPTVFSPFFQTHTS